MVFTFFCSRLPIICELVVSSTYFQRNALFRAKSLIIIRNNHGPNLVPWENNWRNCAPFRDATLREFDSLRSLAKYCVFFIALPLRIIVKTIGLFDNFEKLSMLHWFSRDVLEGWARVCCVHAFLVIRENHGPSLVPCGTTAGTTPHSETRPYESSILLDPSDKKSIIQLIMLTGKSSKQFSN